MLNKIIAGIMGKGTKTTVCYNIAKAIAEETGENTLIIAADQHLFYGLPTLNYYNEFLTGNYDQSFIMNKDTNLDIFTTTSSSHDFRKVEDKCGGFLESIMSKYRHILIDLPGGKECYTLFLRYVNIFENIQKYKTTIKPVFAAAHDNNAIEFSIDAMNNIYQSTQTHTRFEEFHMLFSKIDPALARKSVIDQNQELFSPFLWKIKERLQQESNITIRFDKKMLTFMNSFKLSAKKGNISIRALPHLADCLDISRAKDKNIPFINIILNKEGKPFSINRNNDPKYELSANEVDNIDILKVTDPDNLLLAEKAIKEAANLLFGKR